MTTIWTYTEDGIWRDAAVNAETLSHKQTVSRPFSLVTFGHVADDSVALLLRPGSCVWVNGRLVIAGLKVLAHRDEIMSVDRVWYYSSEAQPSLTSFRLLEGERRPRCGVCRVAVEDGDTAVTCPRCGRVYHQLAVAGERPAKHCFTYRDRCLCGHPTSLSGEAVWRPEEEESRD